VAENKDFPPHLKNIMTANKPTSHREKRHGQKSSSQELEILILFLRKVMTSRRTPFGRNM